MGRIKDWLHEHEVQPQDLPVAIAVHEVLGLGLAIGWWTGAYTLQPTRRLATSAVARRAMTKWPAAQRTLGAAASKGRAWASKAPLLKRMKDDTKRERLIVSFGESLAVRAALKPATFTAKMMWTWQIMKFMKRQGKLKQNA